MKKIVIVLLYIFISSFSANAQTDSISQTAAQQEAAKKVAVKWFSLLAQGRNVDSLLRISKTPFALDKVEILNTKDELRAFYNKVIAKKGQRVIPKFTTKIVGSRYEIIETCIPMNNLIIELRMLEGVFKGDRVLICVEISGKELKIIGFAD